MKKVWYVSDVAKSHMILLNAGLKRKSADNVTEKDTYRKCIKKNQLRKREGHLPIETKINEQIRLGKCQVPIKWFEEL